MRLNLTQNRSLQQAGLKLETDQTTETTLELDLHANNSVLGKDAIIFLDYDKICAKKSSTEKNK